MGVETRKRLSEPSFAFLRHTLAITELAIELIELDGSDQFDLLQLQAEPAAWRNHEANLVQVTLKPDLFVQVADDEYERSWFIEVDCSTESRPTIQRKCHAYVDYRHSGIEQERHGVFPRTLWIAPDESRADQLRRAIASDRQIDDALFDVTTTNSAVSKIIGTDGKP